MTLRQKLEQLIASWPDDRGDKPDTNYQRGYMAAAEERAGAEGSARGGCGWVAADRGSADGRHNHHRCRMGLGPGRRSAAHPQLLMAVRHVGRRDELRLRAGLSDRLPRRLVDRAPAPSEPQP